MESSKKLVAMFLVCIVVLSYSVHVSNAADEDSARRFVDKAHADYAACFNDCDEDCTHQGLGFTFCEVKCDEDCTDQLLKAQVSFSGEALTVNMGGEAVNDAGLVVV
ncbi:putative F-box/kelch-repeat protein SKIP30-like [Capsicum annuum]|nr:putative F-box/kelch-repeat protein SKIP30-like [Capsicum annuum]